MKDSFPSKFDQSRYNTPSTAPTIGISNVHAFPEYVEASINKMKNLHTSTIPNNLNPPKVLDYQRLTIKNEDLNKSIQELEGIYHDEIRKLVIEDLEDINGLMLLGDRNDVPPELYNQSQHEKTLIDDNPRRTLYVRTLLQVAKEYRITPILAICGSHQQYGVLKKATLHQHLPDESSEINHLQRDAKHQFVHDITVAPLSENGGGALFGIINPKARPPLKPVTIPVNSIHHQALHSESTPHGLNIVARAPDQTIEAVEPINNLPVISIQFHPETIKRLDHFGERTLFDTDFTHDHKTGDDYYQGKCLPKDPDYYTQQRIMEDLVVKAHAHHAHKNVMAHIKVCAKMLEPDLNENEKGSSSKKSFSMRILQELSSKTTSIIPR